MKQRTFAAKFATQDGRFSLLVFLLSALVVAVVGYTLIFVVSASFSNPDLVLHGKMVLLPKGFNVNAYREVFRNAKIWQGYWNTIVLDRKSVV